MIKTTRVQTNARARSPGGDAHPACRCLSRNAWLLIAEEYSAHEPGQLPIRQNSRFWVSATSGTLIVLGIPNGGSVRVLPGRACHSALRCRAGISRGRGYRPGTGWTSLGEPIGGWPRVSMSGTAGGGPIMRRNPCGSHGRPPSGPPGTEGTVLICPCAAGRRGLPDGGSTRFYGGSTRWQGHRGGSCRSSGRLSPRCPEVGAS